jgi:hypothetical protein
MHAMLQGKDCIKYLYVEFDKSIKIEHYFYESFSLCFHDDNMIGNEDEKLLIQQVSVTA